MVKSSPTDTPSPSEQLLSPAISQLIALFEERGDELQFPGVTAESLCARRDELSALVSEVERLERLAGEAKENFFLQQEALRIQAKQAHAYATIYASGLPAGASDSQDDKAELRAQLAAINLDVEPRAGRKRRPATQQKSRTTKNAAQESASPPQEQSSEENAQPARVEPEALLEESGPEPAETQSTTPRSPLESVEAAPPEAKAPKAKNRSGSATAAE